MIPENICSATGINVYVFTNITNAFNVCRK